MSSLLLLLAMLQDGIVLERKVKLVLRDSVDRVREIQRTERVKLQAGNLVVEDLTFGTRLIVRGDKKLAWLADPLAGTYSELTFEAIAKRRKEMIEEIVKAKERVAGSSEEKALADILIGLGEFPVPPKAEIKETSKTEKIAGASCVGRELILDGSLQRLDVLVDPNLADALPYFDLMAALGGYPAPVVDALKKLGGFPLKGKLRYSLFMDRVTADEEVTSVRREKSPAADFELPEGLRKIPLAGFEPVETKKPPKPKEFKAGFKEDDLEKPEPPKDEKKETPK
jgi:hypothetical protein